MNMNSEFPDSEKSVRPHAYEWIAGGGEMGKLIRSTDWASTQLGPIESWPQSLRSAVSILLPSKAQIAMFWGPDLITLYNDAYRPVLGKKHPGALGLPIREVWSELWVAGLKELFEGVLQTGEAFWASDHPFYMERFGFLEETFFDISYDPIRDESGSVAGLFCIVSDTTARVISERRLRTLRDLSLFAAAETKSVEHACRTAADILSRNQHDIPFALIYLLDQTEKIARLMGSSRLEAGTRAAPTSIDLADESSSGWPLQTVIKANRAAEVTDVIAGYGELPGGVWPEAPHTAVVMPIGASGQDRAVGVLVAGVSPRRPLDDSYRGFFDLLATQISTTVSNARAYEEERRRAEALAELDRAKTAFFSNVSHEFRTPLTLMLGPVADMLADFDESVPAAQRERLEIAHRNGLRLQKLVNTLLDFSRIEAGRVQASYEPTNLAKFTAELASNFRSACDRAGIDLVVDCPALGQPIYVDPDMWEKIVLNLISNAFKFTLSGRIEVRMRESDNDAELFVQDTGVGIPADELPKLFERFHRVELSRGRTQEGSGIGLALVRELVKLHSGSVRVESVVDRGSVFTVSLPKGSAHLPQDHINARRTLASTALGAAPFVSEALRWLPSRTVETVSAHSEPSSAAAATGFDTENLKLKTSQGLIVLADDNADMRDYVSRLLAGRYEVIAVADGQSALNVIEQQRPDLVLSDVMMPVMDGFEFLRRVRANEQTREIPVILLSARAGEESRIEALEASADDYLVKPFSARELLALVDTHLKTVELRRQSREALRASEERYRQIFEQSIDGVFVATPDGRYVDVSPSGCEMFGMTREEVLDRTFIDVVASEEHHRLPEVIGELFDGKVHHSEWRFRRKDGSIFIGEVAGRALPDGRLQGIVRDITERKRAEHALRESEERFAKAFNASPLALTISSLATGKLLEVNQTFVDVTGYSRDEAIGHTTVELGLWANIDDRKKEMERVLQTGNVRNSEYVFRRRNGDEVVGLLSAERIELGSEPCALTVIQDITERKHNELAIAQQNKRLAVLWEAAGVLLKTEDPDPMLRGLFEKIRDSLGLDVYFNFMVDETRDELRLVSCAGIDDATAQSISQLAYGKAVCGTVALRRVPIVATHIQESAEPMVQLVKGLGLRAYACNPLIAGGRLLGTLSFASRTRDCFDHEEIEFLETISHYVTLAYERLHLIQQLREQDHRKDEFLATLAHELRNPLAPIRNGLELIRLANGERDKLEQATTIMQRQIGQMVRLVDDLLDVARISRNKLELRKELVDLETVVHSAVDTSAPIIEASKNDLQITLPSQNVRLNADPVRLAQVISNLLNNSARYSEPGGRISLTVTPRDNELIVKVSDTGVGIEPEKLSQIFDMFVQLPSSERRANGGLGLGLTLVRRLTEMHGGTVEARSDGLGKGSEFIVRLPVIATKDSQSSRIEAGTVAAAGSDLRRRILVVDDNVDSAQSMAMMLELSGHQVAMAYDGVEAIQLAEEFLPDVAFLDLGMPRLNGYEAARTIREKAWGRQILLVALTGWGQEDDKRRTREAGFNAHIVKPIDFAALEELLATTPDGAG